MAFGYGIPAQRTLSADLDMHLAVRHGSIWKSEDLQSLLRGCGTVAINNGIRFRPSTGYMRVSVAVASF